MVPGRSSRSERRFGSCAMPSVLGLRPVLRPRRPSAEGRQSERSPYRDAARPSERVETFRISRSGDRLREEQHGGSRAGYYGAGRGGVVVLG
jgi:hypothetical protein